MSRIFRMNKYPPLKRWDICSFNPCGFTYAIKSFWDHIMKWIKVRHKARIRYRLDPMDGFSRELCYACQRRLTIWNLLVLMRATALGRGK